MGVSIDSTVAIICDRDERDWKCEGIDGQPIGSYSYECLVQEDYRVVSKREDENVINAITISEGGTVIRLSSKGFGVIAPETIALPESVNTVVRYLSHLQGDDFHLLEVVGKEDWNGYDWSLENKEDKQHLSEPPPPADWESDPDDWYESDKYREHFDGFEQRFATMCREAINFLAIPLTPEQLDEFRKVTAENCERSTGWWRDLRKAEVAYAFQGVATSDAHGTLFDLATCYDDDDFSFEPTEDQAFKALLKIANEQAGTLSLEELWEGQDLLEVFTADELVPIVKAKPEYLPYFYKWLFRIEGEPDEAIIMNPAIYPMFRKELTADMAKFDGWGDDGKVEVDGRHKERNEMMKEDGWLLDETGFAQEQEEKRAVWEKEQAEREVVASEERKERKAERQEELACRSDHDIFMDALNDCYMDDIFANAERFKASIHANIQDIAELHTEENELCLSGSEPAWLIELFDKHGVVYSK